MRINTLLISALLCLPLTSAYANNYSNKVYAKISECKMGQNRYQKCVSMKHVINTSFRYCSETQ